MIDIHTHILPGVDDGARDMAESVTMAWAAVDEGITDIIATPHHANGAYVNKGDDILSAVEELNKRLMMEGVPLKIHPGQEIRVHDDMLDAWNRRELLTLAETSYILLEMPGSSIPRSMHEIVHELTVMGLRPVIAHPERNLAIIKNPALLLEMIENGAYAQVTAGSLLGGFGAQAQRCAWSLCRKGWVHVISSDAHRPTGRGFQLREAYKKVRSEISSESVLFYKGNADLLHRNQLMDSNPAEENFERTWRGLFKKFLK